MKSNDSVHLTLHVNPYSLAEKGCLGKNGFARNCYNAARAVTEEVNALAGMKSGNTQ
jgi:hypothetical protein